MDINSLSKNILIKLKILENMAQDYESNDSVVTQYIETLTTKFILNNLDSSDRTNLYSILEINEDDKAIKFIREKIPQINKKLSLEIKNGIGEILK